MYFKILVILVMQSWIFFSVTWSLFRNHSSMLISCSKKSYYYQC